MLGGHEKRWKASYKLDSVDVKIMSYINKAFQASLFVQLNWGEYCQPIISRHLSKNYIFFKSNMAYLLLLAETIAMAYTPHIQ